MARKSNGRAANLESGSEPVRGATLRPVRMVKRELVSPRGDVVEVEVPVYPPFRLETPEERRRRKGSKGQSSAA